MKMDREKKRNGAMLLVAPMAIWTILFVVATLGYIVYLSFTTRAESGMGVTAQFTLDNYLRLLDPNYLKVLGNSLKLAAITTLICLLVGYPFGYLMAKAPPRRRAILMLLVIVPFWTNALVRVYGWRILLMGDGPINVFLQTLGLIDKPLKLLNTFGAVVLGMVYALLPFMILPTYSSVEKMDWALVEASRDMGASPLRAFCTVTLPFDCAGRAGGLRFDVRALHRPVLHERPFGRGQRCVPRQPHQRPALKEPRLAVRGGAVRGDDALDQPVPLALPPRRRQG